MNYHVITTFKCNLNCQYCGAGSRDYSSHKIKWSMDDLKKFISQDTDPLIAFYGGEPLLRADLVKKVMDNVPATYAIQTNGILLDKLEESYIKKFHSILISLDGEKEVTDTNRGDGVFDKVMTQVKRLREMDYQGDVIARMTISANGDVLRDVMVLLEMEPHFDHVHWQLDFCLFWEGGTHPEKWIESSYNPGITKLVDKWLQEMEKGKVLGIVPFLGVMGSFLRDEKEGLRCGCGNYFFAIEPSGKIASCPVTPEEDGLVLGDIYHSKPKEIRNSARLQDPCASCDILDDCGGRCLIMNHNQENMADYGYPMMCWTVRHFISEMRRVQPRVQELIDKDVVTLEDFNYPKLNVGCEIIP